MTSVFRIAGRALLGAGLFIVAIAGSGCAGRVRVYDDYHSDWHRWNRNEDLEYRYYWNERREPYRDYHRLDKEEQKRYWNWRHDYDNHDRH